MNVWDINKNRLKNFCHPVSWKPCLLGHMLIWTFCFGITHKIAPQNNDIPLSNTLYIDIVLTIHHMDFHPNTNLRFQTRKAVWTWKTLKPLVLKLFESKKFPFNYIPQKVSKLLVRDFKKIRKYHYYFKLIYRRFLKDFVPSISRDK